MSHSLPQPPSLPNQLYFFCPMPPHQKINKIMTEQNHKTENRTNKQETDKTAKIEQTRTLQSYLVTRPLQCPTPPVN